MGTEPESLDAQKGTMKDVFARCASMYIAQNVCIIIKRNFNLIASIAGKPTFEIYIV